MLMNTKKYKKVCYICNKEFLTNGIGVKTCSRSCTSKMKWSDKDYKDRVTSSIQIAAVNPERNKKISEFHKMYQNLPSVKAKHIKRQKKSWDTEESRNRRLNSLREVFSSEEWIEGCKIRSKEIANRQDVKDKKTKGMIARWNEDGYRDAAIARQKVSQSKLDVRERKSKTMIKNWSDPAYADKQFKSIGKYKEFILPSGKMIKLQGYEPQVLDDLLNYFLEEDIVHGAKNINNEVGSINYFYKEKERRYYPDFYIKSLNMIIEVKSMWTYNMWIEKNLLKKRACLEMGLNFEFVIR